MSKLYRNEAASTKAITARITVSGPLTSWLERWAKSPLLDVEGGRGSISVLLAMGFTPVGPAGFIMPNPATCSGCESLKQHGTISVIGSLDFTANKPAVLI